MKKNLGKLDGVLRIIAAIFLGLLYMGGAITGLWGIISLFVAIIFLITSFVGVCPIYSVLGINTCEKRELKH
jgi:uncharacterized membrane protein HdeD (DUF308 family)